MDEVFIDMRNQNKWIQKYFPNKDFVSIDELIGCIEDLDGDVESLKEELREATKSDAEKYDDYVWYKVDEQYERERLGEI